MSNQATTGGRFITVEGVEGAGKSTQLEAIRRYFAEIGMDPLFTREPGGTVLGEALRDILLDPQYEGMDENTELLLMYAARAEHVEKRVKPALQSGRWVVCDRFVDASFAYQGGGRGIDLGRIEQLSSWVLGDFVADLTLVLDLSPEVGLARATSGQAADRIERESLSFFERVRGVYMDRARKMPDRYRIIDASSSEAEVTSQIEASLREFMESL